MSIEENPNNYLTKISSKLVRKIKNSRVIFDSCMITCNSVQPGKPLSIIKPKEFFFFSKTKPKTISVLMLSWVTKQALKKRKQPLRKGKGVPRKRCSENMQQICRRTHIAKVWFQWNCIASLLKSHFGMGVLL